MATAQQLEQIFGVSFTEQPTIQALRQFHAKNTYCRNEEGAVIGLYASENDWTSLSIPADLQELQHLILSDNKSLQSLSFEGTLPKLRHLDVSDSSLQDLKIPAGFDKLEWLDASRNKLIQFAPMGTFGKLRYLDLSGNALNNFQSNQLEKFPALQGLYLKGNPLPDSKKTSVEKQANCLGFMQQFQRSLLEKGATENKEYKVLVVGNGGVGKTCLVNRLVFDAFDANYISTHGIALEKYEKEEHADAAAGVSLGQYDKGAQFPYILNIWDFGGQDIYHATHRLFMQSSSVYLVLWDENTRQNDYSSIFEDKVARMYKNFPLSYWLYYIQQQGGKNSVIVVKTKAKDNDDEHPSRGTLKSKFHDAFLTLDFHQIDSAVDDWSENGINRLLFFVKEAIAKLKREEELPLSWAGLRQHLRGLQRKRVKALSIEDYIDIASDYGEEENAMAILQDWLMPSGVVFYRKGYFHDTIILDQAWAMKAVYTLFNRTGRFNYYTVIQSKKGQFDGEDLTRYWPDYTEAERQLFVNFMLSCELCFEVTEKKENHYPGFKERKFVAPQLMPPNPPAAIIKYFRKNEGLLHIKYRQNLLHYGIIQSFIVRTQALAK